MLVPIEWLNDYIDIDVSDEEFCDRMIMSGSNLETCEHFCEEMERVVVGKIEKIEKHPDADKLVVCQINTGEEEPIQIVTGAPNVFEGALVPVALHKSRIPGPVSYTHLDVYKRQIHHHFEKCGFSEVQVVAGFWIFAVLCCVAGFFII